ncbi:LLM class flavin-dependent oxidoreductase [Luteolibacter pohnpeiensis]|uniref:LLM class flavin-dependent oxidoreductase n=1 Tax=Luteolibacter pohnpeiensis TaxID=454153 RepID=UPI001F296185|nr:LLM class flavin-dependent oxidoreductase [Luteolibacter pohnpeiensis]
MIPLSVLDLSPILQGEGVSQSFAHTLALARHVESLGYHRFWLAEHHNIPGVASAATSVLIGHVAAGTQSIRVGSGGIMLPNHAPLVIAEQFGTLEALFPGRIDLGLGRAPGGDPLTAKALRRNLGSSGDTFPQDVLELQGYLDDAEPGQALKAIPGVGSKVPLYLLGSSDFSARLAAELGLPFAFASHFAPDYLHTALSLYRKNYRPSAAHPEPHAMVCVNVVAADTDDEARFLFTTLQQQFLNLIRRGPQQLPPPARHLHWTLAEQQQVGRMSRCSMVGSAETVQQDLTNFIKDTAADEVIATAQIFDQTARLRSFEILAEVMKVPASLTDARNNPPQDCAIDDSTPPTSENRNSSFLPVE